jgi:hypothetical protein
MRDWTAQRLGQLSYRARRMGHGLFARIAPGLGESLRKTYWKRRMRAAPEVLARFEARGELQVEGGPFAGMRLASVHSGSALLPKLTGSYEDEIGPVIEAVNEKHYDTILDLGSAEGYYAVGLARNCPDARIIAFDCSPAAQDALRALAQMNGVSDRIEVHGACTFEGLNQTVKEGAFILCDIEGAERTLLDPDRCPALLGCDLLVELHVQQDKDTADVVKARFAATHEMNSFYSRVKTPEDYPVLRFLPPRLRAVALDEMRPPGQEWVWLRRRTRTA